jgi:ketosteroid isomerase-like protein
LLTLPLACAGYWAGDVAGHRGDAARDLRGGHRRDWDRVFRDLHPDFELTTPPGLNAGTYRGRAEIQGYFEDWDSIWEESSGEPTDFIERGDKVVVLITFRNVPKGGNAAIEVHNAHLWCNSRWHRHIDADVPRP